jgi:hypothetical protein
VVDAKLTAGNYDDPGNTNKGSKRFHAMGLWGEDGSFGVGEAPSAWPGLYWGAGGNEKPWSLRNIPSIMQLLGHERLAVRARMGTCTCWDTESQSAFTMPYIHDLTFA